MAASFPHTTICIGNPDNRRIALFQAALAALGWPPARVVAYRDLLSGAVDIAKLLTLPAQEFHVEPSFCRERGAPWAPWRSVNHELTSPGPSRNATECVPYSSSRNVTEGVPHRLSTVVRIDSPGEDFEVEKSLLRKGYATAAEEGSPALPPGEIDCLPFDRGRILYPRQWYLGFQAALRLIAAQLSAALPHRLLSQPAEIETLFDKPACQRRLAQAGVPVPPFWPPPRCYEEVREHLLAIDCRRAFIKLAHGSSASGVVALDVDRRGTRAVTSCEVVRDGGEFELYNSLRVRTYTDERDVRELIDELCRQRVQFEQWLPKASLDGRTFDLRVVVIGGRARHVVVRSSRTPMTNLHLGNRRGNLAALVERAGGERWREAMEVCEAAAAVFSGCWHVGVDLLLQPGFRRPAVLEINAFGDLLPGVFHEGQDTYTAEIAALVDTPPPAESRCKGVGSLA